jgi:hypothetical protein
MKESKAMVKKEVSFMKKKGAPKSMIKHEMKEAGMKKMASGGLAAGHKSADGIAHKGKTKGKEVKMALGGAAMGAVRNAAAAPKQFLSNAIRSGAMKPPTGGMMGAGQRGLGGMPVKPSGGGIGGKIISAVSGAKKAAPMPVKQAPMPVKQASAQRKFDAARAYSPDQTTMLGKQAADQRRNGVDPRNMSDTKSLLAGRKAGMTGIGSQMASKPQMGGVNSALKKVGTTVSRAVMGRKAGGLAAGHKEADGIAKKGKTKAMQVKMAGGGKTKKYC